MFNEDKVYEDLAEYLLENLTLEELLEHNNMTELELVVFLLKHGMLSEPSELYRGGYDD